MAWIIADSLTRRGGSAEARSYEKRESPSGGFRRLTFGGPELEAPQLPAAYDVDLDGAADPVAVQHPDQIVNAGHRLAVEPHHDIVGHQARGLRRSVRIGAGDHRAEIVVDSGRAGVPPRHRHGLRRDADEAAPHPAVLEDLAQHVL